MARIAGINIPQNKVVSIALTYIHGIGPYSSKKICDKLESKFNLLIKGHPADIFKRKKGNK